MAYRYPYHYRAALRRARYGGGMPGWQKVAAGVAIAGALAGTAGKAAHAAAGDAAPAPSLSGKALVALSFARHQIGCPYTWGGTGPCGAGFDCSGLVMMAYASAGVSIPRTSETQWAGLRHVPPGQQQPGDLVFFAGADGTVTSPGHVGLVLTRRRMIDAYDAGTPVRIETYGLPTSAGGLQNPVGFARPVPPARTLAVSATSYTPATWARALLRGAGYRRTACNVAAVTAWQNAEGDWAHGHAGWRNPLNDTRPMPGSSPVNSKNVQKYTSWSQGLAATVATLGGPDYRGIRAALAAGNDARAVAHAVGASVWGTQVFTAEC